MTGSSSGGPENGPCSTGRAPVPGWSRRGAPSLAAPLVVTLTVLAALAGCGRTAANEGPTSSPPAPVVPGAAPTVRPFVTLPPSGTVGPPARRHTVGPEPTPVGGVPTVSPTMVAASTSPAQQRISAGRGTQSPTLLPASVPTVVAPSAATLRPGVTANSPAARPLTSLPGGNRYSDPQGRFSLRVPTGWTKISNSQGAEVTFTSPDKAMTVTVTLQAVPSDYTLDAYSAAVDRAFRLHFPDYLPVSLERIDLADQPAYKRVSTVGSGDDKAQLAQFYLLAPAGRGVQGAQTVNCGAKPVDYDSLASVCEGIAASYQLGTPAR